MSKLEKQIDEYLAYCVDVKNLAPKTIYLYQESFRMLVEDVEADRIEKVTNEMIEEHFKKRGWCPASVNCHITQFKTMFKWFRRRGVKLKFNPELMERAIVPQSQAVYYTKEEIEAVLKTCNGLTWLLIRLAFEGGLRINELNHLKPSDIDGNRITFMGKGRKRREVYISDELKTELEKWISDHAGWEYLWMWEFNGKRRLYTVNGLRANMKRPFQRMGYDEFHPHALRHSFATHILHAGAPLHVVRDMMGHSNVRTTERYIHALDGQLEKAFSKYGAY